MNEARKNLRREKNIKRFSKQGGLFDIHLTKKCFSYWLSFFTRFPLFVVNDAHGTFRIDVPFPEQKKIQLILEEKGEMIEVDVEGEKRVVLC